MFKTPPIPQWIKEIRHPGYRNIYSFGLLNRNLWGTETLLGDWDGEYLLLAKDFYPARYIEELAAAGMKDAYRHNPHAPTNRNLLKTLRNFGFLSDPITATNSNFLYASACFLLRDDGKIRGPLPDATTVLSLSAPVIAFTMDNMPNLKCVVAMGRDAEVALKDGGLADAIGKRGLAFKHVSHPSVAMSDAKRYAEWIPILGDCQTG